MISSLYFWLGDSGFPWLVSSCSYLILRTLFGHSLQILMLVLFSCLRRKLSLIRKLKPRHITEGEWLCISFLPLCFFFLIRFLPLCLVMANNAFLSKVLVDHGALRIALQFCRSFVLCSATALVLISIMRTTWGSAISYGHGIFFSSQIHISLD